MGEKDTRPGRETESGTSPEEADSALFLREIERHLLVCKFAVDELMTKLRILSEEFDFVREHDPIEHISHRIKQPESILRKLRRRGLSPDVVSVREHLDDVAGVRVVCPFVSDVYTVARLLGRQNDVTVIQTKDYIAQPKPNGYRSLHLIVEIPVFLSDGVEQVRAEVQLRTIGMDFWAALEHQIFYKYDHSAPEGLLEELTAVAEESARLDLRMEALHQRMREGSAPA
ncbi:GTP pyrophosphokinase [Marinactinospora thermotolerans]|uniref:Putative GTP pyrophosphokinase n=1 Tax=Marinactinospora thermotolerans DSM 45154 TaxID=1122192 RepID=A0A1T4JZK4_9ACTN|nr:GTP pyrophosphokinase family protein [Marinactinospora thermotolerans]SJZ35601.1 putative GTP pyrophosphokinase [Marinactinospora thermotolerans DSM 45154]